MQSSRSGAWWGWAIVAVTVGVAGCDAKGGRTEYSNSADSGAAAPATQIDTSMTRTMPDSTTGGPDRTGKRGVAGDTLSTRGRPAGVTPAPAPKRP
jgi:hypothetical protein